MADQKIEAGDIVRHGPTGEEWLALGVDSRGGKLVAYGWPPSMANLSDCQLVRKGTLKITADERRYRIEKWGRIFDDDREEDARMDREFAL